MKSKELVQIEALNPGEISKISDELSRELPLHEELIENPRTQEEYRTLKLRDELGKERKIEADVDPVITIPAELF